MTPRNRTVFSIARHPIDPVVTEDVLSELLADVWRHYEWHRRRYAKVLAMRYLSDPPSTRQQIADVIGVTAPRVREIERNALRILRETEHHDDVDEVVRPGTRLWFAIYEETPTT
jgi:DNA-directed RNA polymerase sigma subunit (sigma70/sigma32)